MSAFSLCLAIRKKTTFEEEYARTSARKSGRWPFCGFVVRYIEDGKLPMNENKEIRIPGNLSTAVDGTGNLIFKVYPNLRNLQQKTSKIGSASVKFFLHEMTPLQLSTILCQINVIVSK